MNTPGRAKGDEEKLYDLNGLENFLDALTPAQATITQTVLRYGSVSEAAKAMGMNPSTLRGKLSEARRRAAKRGWAPEYATHGEHPTPEGYNVKGVSTYFRKNDETGGMEVRGRWVKTDKEKEHQLAVLLDAIEPLADKFRGKSPKARAPKALDRDLLCVYPMGDPHVGMFSWAKETGEDFDLKIAEDHLITAVDQLVSIAPPAREALVINLGDFFHADNKSNTTTAGTRLDLDTRWAKVLSVGIRTMRRIIDRALERHRVVNVMCAIGNHDEHGSIVLALCLEAFYSNNPRVKVSTTPDPFQFFRFGQCLLGVTHGNTVKPDQLPNIMACDRKEDWGATSYRHWYTGHVHHDSLREYAGCKVETFRTLAPRDAWHHASGYRSGQDMKVDVLHREWGHLNRHIVGIQQIKARSGGAK